MIGTDKLSRPLEVEITIPVRTYDIDFAGIVSNIVYIKWLEDLRLKFLDEHLPLETEIARGSVPIVSKTEIEYKRPIKLFESVIGRLWIANFGRIKYTIQAEIISNNNIAATATQVGTFISTDNGRPVKIPDKLLQKYSQSKLNSQFEPNIQGNENE
ncbi:MAG: thioesterase family protein [Mastigocoleus sp. MO_167.B18]|nr:thioesterase family protein [Mastigocoleus sp. MO_167.B18]